MAEQHYAAAIRREFVSAADCIDHYYQAATIAWHITRNQANHPDASRARDIYDSSVAKLIQVGPRFHRFHPARGLTIHGRDGAMLVPTKFHGFPRRPDEFDFTVLVGSYSTALLDRKYRNNGLGIPILLGHYRRPGELFCPPRQTYAATVVLRPSCGHSPTPFVLDFIDSLRISSLETEGTLTPLKGDISAPIAFALQGVERNYVREFLQPGSSTGQDGLFMMEPYQRGKIPLVFVHGLLSDPFTWATLANELRARPDLMARYQIWAFKYATGEPFLASAARLRQQLREVQVHVDPHGTDAALAQMVLVGHSMGGLVSKLQTTGSGDRLWQSVANRPFYNIPMDPDVRNVLRTAFFFEPVVSVKRVVFIATPHQGSAWAERPIGRLGAALVNSQPGLEIEHQELIQNNPTVFSREFSRRVPTSIDLLKPSSPLLHAIYDLPPSPHVEMHSIVGVGRWILGEGASDGVVPLSSTQHDNVSSQVSVRARHDRVHRTPIALNELLRILRMHATQFE